jgi:hypothetical protein
MTVEQVWLEPAWLSWARHVESAAGVDHDAADRTYEVQQHACDRLVGDPTDLDRVDAITTLKRAVSHRVKMLAEAYELRDLPVLPKPKRDLELLASFDLIRPFMLKRLTDIRNLVEHEDCKPPSTDECLMFADLVWYFLRSTDMLLRARIDDFVFIPHGVDTSVREFYPAVGLIFPANFSQPPQIRAWLEPPSFSYDAVEGWVKVETCEIRDYSSSTPARFSIEGQMVGTGEQMRLLYEAYFKQNVF